MRTPNLRISRYFPSRSIAQRLLSPGYRFAISKKLAKATKCTDVLLFDHIRPTDPSIGKGIKTPIGYEKCLIAAIPLSSSMDVHVLLQTPPLPAEMRFAQQLRGFIPNRKRMHVWWEANDKGAFIDIYELYKKDENAYISLVEKTLQHPPSGSNTYHVSATKRLVTHVKGKILILPFQMTDWHKETFKPLVDEGKVVMPDSADPWVNKGKAHLFFENNGAADLRPYAQYLSMEDIRGNTPQNVGKVAKRVAAVCKAMKKKNKIPFIKLAADGLSGFGIITPHENPLLDKEGSEKSRFAKFEKMVDDILQGTLSIPDAVIEEYIPLLADTDGKKEYILSGIMIEKKLYVWSVSRSIVDEKGVYQGVIVSPNLADIGLVEDCLIKAHQEGERLATAMSLAGYHTGYMAKDFVLTMDESDQERHIYHDDNDRRGGRTVADVTAALTRKGYCDRNYTLTIPQGVSYTECLLRISRILQEKGLFVYGTGSVYTSKKKITLRILTPLDLIKSNARYHSSRSISEQAKAFVLSVLQNDELLPVPPVII